MREGIHPKYNAAKVVCACGNVIETRSTRGDFHIEICSNCHPFFTGKQKIMDTAGRIERFKTRYAATPGKQEAKPIPAPAPKAEPSKQESKENRAAKRAKANAGKPKPKAAKPEEGAAAEAAPAAPESKDTTPTA
jgi:large subunit ribosomal protein L31